MILINIFIIQILSFILLFAAYGAHCPVILVLEQDLSFDTPRIQPVCLPFFEQIDLATMKGHVSSNGKKKFNGTS